MIEDIKKMNISELSALVCTTLKQQNIDVTLVGGSCVSIYTQNKYQSYDLDFISHSNKRKIDMALDLIGFTKNKNRYYTHPDCEYYIEFVSPPVSIGEEKIDEFNTIKNNYGEIKLLKPTDCVKDRLAAFYHWNDHQSLEQAILVTQDNEIDLKEIQRWSKKEKQLKKYKEFLSKLN